jgi:hypothetical protein
MTIAYVQKRIATLEKQATAVIAAQEIAVERGCFEIVAHLGEISLMQIRSLNDWQQYRHGLRCDAQQRPFLHVAPAFVGMN